MNLRDMLKDAMDIAGMPIPDKNFIRQYNRCIHDLAMRYDTAKKPDTQVIECVDVNAEHDLTAGCLKIERVLNSNKQYYPYFKVRNNSKILFSHKGTYTVFELFKHDSIATMDDEPQINPVFAIAMAEYIAANEVKSNSADVSRVLMQEYYEDADRANLAIRGASNPVKRARAPLWR